LLKDEFYERLLTLIDERLDQGPVFDREAADRAERSLSEYVRQAWPIVEPGAEYLHNWHIDAIAECLEAVTAGQIRRLIINIPPRYMKSIAVSVMWPTWEWIRQPETRWIFASYSQSLSTKHSVDRRTIIQSDWYLRNWGSRFKLTTDQNVKTEFMNNRRGVMVATSVGGTLTGKGGNRVVVDDPHNPKEAQSDIQRQAGVDFFKHTLSTRLDDKRRGAIVVVMQRLHEQDLTGYLLEQGGWEHLCLPAEAEGRTVISLPSGREIVREDGELLWPEREGPAEIEQAKKDLGSYGYAGQYQQRPSPAEGGIFKRWWWRFWRYGDRELPPVTVKKPDGELINIEAVPLPETFYQTAQSWDMAFKDTKGSAFVAGQAWGKNGANYYLLDQVRDRWDFVATIGAFRGFTQKWPQIVMKLVEDKANGPAVISTLQREIPGIIAVQPEGSKEARAHAVSPLVEAGNVFLPHPAIALWVWDFIEECAAFPRGCYRDQVDAMTQALNKFQASRYEIY